MKKLLFIITIALSTMVQGQILHGQIIWSDSSISTPPQPIYDTIPVIMLVCDTMSDYLITFGDWEKIYYPKKEGPVFWIRGYEIKRSLTIMQYVIQPMESDYCVDYHVSYLTSDKKPMKYMVWMSMSRKEEK
jgi:hypothetical protein